MDAQSDVLIESKTTAPRDEQPALEPKSQPFLLRVLKNPLFLVVFTWVLMAFLLAFEVTGK